MSFQSVEGEAEKTAVHVQQLFVGPVEESSEEPPMDEWESLIFMAQEESKRKTGKVDPERDVCTAYVAQSDSFVFRHPYYAYPGLLDPGIMEALLQPEPKAIYADDGQELYLAICKEMDQCPVGLFYRGLLTTVIDLSYYCVNSQGVRAMCLALSKNRTVKTLSFAENFLSIDACYHLGDLFLSNQTITELNLSLCKIGPVGLENLLEGLRFNFKLRTLILVKNNLADEGGESMANAIANGLELDNLNLSCNGLSTRAAVALYEALQHFNAFKKLDLSWNSMVAAGPVFNLLSCLGSSDNLQELNFSWNALFGDRIGAGFNTLLKGAKNLAYLDLSNNKLQDDAILAISRGLSKAKKLQTLNLSHNPLTPDDALRLLAKLRLRSVKLKELLMDNVEVTPEFLVALDAVRQVKGKADIVVTFGRIKTKFTTFRTDPREILLKRLDFLSQKAKKNRIDIVLYFMELFYRQNIKGMTTKDLFGLIKKDCAQIDLDILDELAELFPDTTSKKAVIIDFEKVLEYMKRMWPDKKLPPLLPEIVKEPKEKKNKGKGKGKK